MAKIEVTGTNLKDTENLSGDDSFPQWNEQAKQLTNMLGNMQESIRRLTETVIKVEEENKQLKARSKLLEKRANQAVTRPSLALSISFGSSEELFGSLENKHKDEKSMRYRSPNLLVPGGSIPKEKEKEKDKEKENKENKEKESKEKRKQ